MRRRIWGMVLALGVLLVSPVFTASRTHALDWSTFVASDKSGQTLESAAPEPAKATDGSAEEPAQRLEDMTEALYRYASEGDVNKARATAEAISALFASSSFGDRTSVEGINALSGTIIDMKTAMNAVNMQPDRWISAAARLRLAVNSLNHARQPMWMQYYKLMLEDMKEMERGAAAGDSSGWTTALKSLRVRYDLIRPAVLVDRRDVEANRFDAWLSFAEGLGAGKPAPGREERVGAISHGREAVRALFGKEKDEPTLSTPLAPKNYGMAGWLAGGFILAALAYTGFRKYKGERDRWNPL
ncbi:hypothetical protein KIH86_04760 [Paenibacillus sp. HN-1]|uniref:sporulation protein YpjB n=1 Tax=Paenibacillus TaxID=44249 RepID=UPI001CA8E81F|nr:MULTISPECIES: sporulation protein YpjB [Paenibacillus]MBY9081672.1 hypothetical protein [Paenibacillus sp. CGMCC 1.18879]MBY9083541.1 hypothetical protein [Paenibacillus sinensis]